MKVIFTKHAKKKFKTLKQYGWEITINKVKQTINTPKWVGNSRFGQKTAMSLVDNTHILRVILNKENDKITVVTFHIARKGKYESSI